MRGQKFSYLKQFVDQGKEEYALFENCFWSLDGKSSIRDAEERLGFDFPIALKEFWLEIGYGFLQTSNSGESTGLDNHIFRPKDIADILLLKEESGLILPEAVEYMPPDEMPFFEIGDMSSFLCMKPLSDRPNSVWGYGEIIEEDFERFIWRLYYESPTYYLNANK
jgi:hypothetical protein